MGLYYYLKNQYIRVAYELITDYSLLGGFNKTGILRKKSFNNVKVSSISQWHAF